MRPSRYVTFAVWVRYTRDGATGYTPVRSYIVKDAAIVAARRFLEESTRACSVTVYRYIWDAVEQRSTATLIWADEKEEGSHD